MMTRSRKKQPSTRQRWVPIFKNLSSPLAETPRKYVSTPDMAALIRLAQLFHQTDGTLENRLLIIGAKLTNVLPVDAWLIGVDFSMTPASPLKTDRPLVLSGGPDRATIDALTIEYAKTLRTPVAHDKHLRELASARPGRVLTLLDNHRTTASPAILSIRCDETTQLITWLSVHRTPDAPQPFNERDRRIVELFHSQTAWGIR